MGDIAVEIGEPVELLGGLDTLPSGRDPERVGHRDGGFHDLFGRSTGAERGDEEAVDLTLPLLLHGAERVHRLPDAAGLRRLRIILPATLAGHGSVQTLHVGADSLICRHDYTATAFGTWARAAQKITSYRTFDGVPIGTSRTVRPRVGRPLPAPTLVWIQIHSVQVAKPD